MEKLLAILEYHGKYRKYIENLDTSDQEEEYENGIRFWEDYFDYFFDKLESEEKIKINLSGQEKRQRKKELAEELIKMTHGDRTFSKLNELIRKKFNVEFNAK